MDLATFVGKYTEILMALRGLVRAGAVAPALVIDALAASPFKLPDVLQNVPGADDVARRLQALYKQRNRVKGEKSAIEPAVRSVIRPTLQGHHSKPLVRGGLGEGGGGAAGMPQAPAGDLLTSITETTRPSTSPAAARPPIQAEVRAPPDTKPTRWISAEFDDHDKNEPLVVGETRTIAFGVDTQQRPNAIGDAVFNDDVVFTQGVTDVELTVELHSDDFDIVAQKSTFNLKDAGNSKNRARFEITPKHDGRATLTATIHKELNFVQQLTISLSVGAADAAPPSSTSFSRPQSGVTALRPRKVMIMMLPAIPNGYQFLVCDEQGSKLTRLEVEPDELASAITAARDSLLGVVQQTNAQGDAVFQAGIDIPAEENGVALVIMARAGARLFQILFKHPGGSADVSNIGQWLRDLQSENGDPMSIQIISDRAPVPWPLLYLGDASAKATFDWKNFLGIRHLVEQLPKVDQLGQGTAVIASNKPKLEVSINLNRKIDDDWRADFVASQETFWAKTAKESPRVHVTSRTQAQEFLDALSDAKTADQVMYFYGHASTSATGGKGGVDASALTLTDAKVTLEQLNTDASTDIKLRGNPLVFINACESAELSPLFYDGFVPYFMMKGARGVVGTECRTPGVFAAAWAQRFFKRFLNGDPLGVVFFELRQEFLAKHGNPLGLLYAVYCSSDTQVQPAL